MFVLKLDSGLFETNKSISLFIMTTEAHSQCCHLLDAGGNAGIVATAATISVALFLYTPFKYLIIFWSMADLAELFGFSVNNKWDFSSVLSLIYLMFITTIFPKNSWDAV